MGFARFPAITVPTILLHLILNLSALEFKIPSKRISSGYRIWPEYRLHSLVFLGRSLAVMALFWYEQTFEKEPNYDWNFAFIILGMVAVDLSSYSQRKFASSTIRDLDTPGWVKFLFSTAQFFGSANIMFGLRHRYSMHMLSVTVIQLNAFMMTVRRKNLASHNGLVTMYGLALFVSMAVSVYEYYRVDETIFLAVSTIGHITVVQRMAPWPDFMKFVSNKYLVWMTAGLLLRQARPWLEQTATVSEMRLIFAITFGPMWFVGWYKSYGPGSRKKDDAIKAA